MELIKLEETTSTNDYLKSKHSELEHGTAVTANRQTEGKGRRGKVWADVTDECEMLFLSVLLKNISNPLQMPVFSAVSAASAISEFTEYDVRVKWPNDILISEKKVCGILCESCKSVNKKEKQVKTDNLFDLICGFGVNLYAPDGYFSGINLPNAASVSDKPNFPAELLRDKIISELLHNITLPYENVLEYYKKICITIGKNVIVHYINSETAAFAAGVSKIGELICTNETGYFSVNAGEVSIRGVIDESRR
jgi:BirA family biotin operon repressor/biotin-[acetyl-CoA-carboxylase] ligase